MQDKKIERVGALSQNKRKIMSYLSRKYDKQQNKIKENRLTEYIEMNQELMKVEPFLEDGFICPLCKGNDAAFFHIKNNVGDVIRYAWCIPCKDKEILSRK